jgi:hypothetical protein
MAKSKWQMVIRAIGNFDVCHLNESREKISHIDARLPTDPLRNHDLKLGLYRDDVHWREWLALQGR